MHLLHRRMALLLALLVLLSLGCLCTDLFWRNPKETDPQRVIKVRVGDEFSLITLWDGTHLREPYEEAITVEYDSTLVELVGTSIQMRSSPFMGGLLMFYHQADFKTLAPGDTAITLRVKAEAWEDELLTDRNQPVSFQVHVVR